MSTASEKNTYHPSGQKHPKVLRQLDAANDGVEDAKDPGHLPPPVLVRHRARERAERGAGEVSDEEQDRDLPFPEPVAVIQLVDVGALEPIT